MLYTKLRFGLVLLFITLGILLHVQMGFGSAWFLYLAAIILVITYFLFGNIWLAFRLLKQGKPDKAEQLLGLIPKPNWLIRRNRAYYYFTKGMILLQGKNLASSEHHLKQALELGLQSKNDKALASLNLAHIYFVQKDQSKAQEFLEQAQSYESDDLMIKEHLEQLHQALNQIPVSKKQNKQ